MGQMTTAILFGARTGKAPKSLGDDGWYGFARRFNPGNGPPATTPTGDYEGPALIGIWVAVGGSGKPGCPDLSQAFPLDDFASTKLYRGAHVRAKKAWAKFAAWAEEQGHKFDEPQLWLVQTEVA